ncbi:Hypothetical predicted protein [Olea europaea subsp. europaea]|uniref:Uncharacterized protein n=1 Tax=Olea europaea subsp. europaea TaxID=158383 RepID=A0A8S0S7R7_OLEEU|nr:Hypothetical predicted protein [Olea europaea subsp. europaea]
MKGSKVSIPKSSSGTSSKSRIHDRKLQAQDINPSEMEMVQPYMDGVLYNKLQESSLSRHSRSSKINRTVKKSKPRILMIIDGRLGHSSDIENDDDDNDDDFVDPPLRRQHTSFPVHSSMDPPMEPKKMYVESSKDKGPSAHMSPPYAA